MKRLLTLLTLLIITTLVLCQTDYNPTPSEDNNFLLHPAHRAAMALLQSPNITTFNYPNYPKISKKNMKSDGTLRQTETKCRKRCSIGLPSNEELTCVRKCTEMSCYTEIYGFNEFELGEVDVRQNSFRNCALKRLQEQDEINRQNKKKAAGL